MPPKKIWLTIDDAPSLHMKTKVDYLKKQGIPALFYVRGSFAATYPEQVIYAIKQGFLIGNHSYTHPYFSDCSLQTCKKEIQETEKIIDVCYQKAGIDRSYKLIRLPFADRGAGGHAAQAKTLEQEQKVAQIQDVLKASGFIQPSFAHKDSFIDTFWDWDTQDYKKKHIEDPRTYEACLQKSYDACQGDGAILLVHDFAHNHHLFELTMHFLQDKEVEFMSFEV